MRYITFALAKGRLAKHTLSLLEQIGITCEEMKDEKTRKLIFVNEELGYRFFLSKATDVPTYVEMGAADIGVVDPIKEDFSAFVFKIQDILRKETELFFEKRVPQRSPQFNEEMPIMDQIEKEDKLLSYPYESMRPFLKMLQEAAEDKDVVSSKIICKNFLQKLN